MLVPGDTKHVRSLLWGLDLLVREAGMETNIPGKITCMLEETSCGREMGAPRKEARLSIRISSWRSQVPGQKAGDGTCS